MITAKFICIRDFQTHLAVEIESPCFSANRIVRYDLKNLVDRVSRAKQNNEENLVVYKEALKELQHSIELKANNQPIPLLKPFPYQQN